MIDAPHEDRADAGPDASRWALRDGYSSTALKCLQPDRNVVVAPQTRWHADDDAG